MSLRGKIGSLEPRSVNPAKAVRNVKILEPRDFFFGLHQLHPLDFLKIPDIGF